MLAKVATSFTKIACKKTLLTTSASFSVVSKKSYATKLKSSKTHENLRAAFAGESMVCSGLMDLLY